MTDQRYSRLGSRIVLGTLNPASNSDDEDIFLSDSIADRPELRVQLRYFTVQLQPSKCSTRIKCGKHASKNNIDTGSKSSSLNDQKKAESGENVSSSETTSCDSFHSCRSSPSIQEVTCKATEIQVKPGNGTKRAVIRDDDLLNHLTMVNAIFLSNSVSDSTHHERSNKNIQETLNGPCKTDSRIISRRPSLSSSSNKVCSETYTCHIKHNPRIKMYGNNVIGKYGGQKLSYTKTFSESFEPVFNTYNKYLETEEGINTYNNNILPTKISEALPLSLGFQNKTSTNSYLSTYKTLEIKVPKMKFAEILPLCNDSQLKVVLDKNNTETSPNPEHTTRRTVPGCEDSLKFGTPTNSVSVISIESEDKFLDTTDIVHGDGDYSDYAYTANIGGRTNKLPFNNIDEAYLRKLISKTFKKVQSESGWSLRSQDSEESDIFESEEEYDGMHEYEEDDSKKMRLNSAPTGLKLNKLKLHSCFEEDARERYNVEHDNDLDLISDDEYHYNDQRSETVVQRSSELVTKQIERGFCKLGTGEQKRTLPVIEEEGSEESIEESDHCQGDNLADDYCLIDSNGRPIHLFDKEGLPLTDNSGRPLRSAQGKLLMKCEQNGIPVVDEDSCIYDMFGRQPHEDRFDPSMAPKMAACSKLSAGDGRPLLLFDANGRPLTSVSGTMLVDSSGRGLVRLSTEQSISSRQSV